jgi:N-acyl-D-amino-acid deacylase
VRGKSTDSHRTFYFGASAITGNRHASPATLGVAAVFLLSLAFIFTFPVPLRAADEAAFDLVIRHGTIINGTGKQPFTGDTAVKAGRIAAIGKFEGRGAREIEARGLAVAPGFIDVHTHGEDILELPLAENFLRMGVTTLVLGNCGSSKLELGEFWRNLATNKPSANIATLIGHNTVRAAVMGGSFMRPPTARELSRMKSAIEKAMREGALGLSTGLIYLPGTFSTTDELVELAKALTPFDGIYVSHMRNEGEKIFEALDELTRIAREARIRAHVSHIKLSGRMNWGQTAKVLAAIEAARRSGVPITQDEYVYTASSTGVSQLLPDAAREGGVERFAQRIADPEERNYIVYQMIQSLRKNGHDNYDYVTIASHKADPALNGLTLPEAAKLRKGSIAVEDQIDLVFDIERNGRATAVFFGMSEDDLKEFLGHTNTMFASDSGVRKFKEGVPHPRGYGNNARVLGRYVRELKLLPIEEAVRRMTSLPAETFRLKDRGLLREGFAADLVVFDPATVRDEATFKDPHRYATGFATVLVNGVPAIERDQHTGARAGVGIKR